MAVQDYKINYKSDFVLTINGDAGWATQFCIKFWTGMPSQAYFVGFDGVKYVNCRVGDTPTQLMVMFDDHHLPIGKLKMQIAYHTTIEEFPGSVFDEVTNARDVIVTIDGTDYQVLLDFTGEDAPELEFNLPAYANEADRIQNELQRQQNEAARIAAELQREQATAAAVQGAENVNAQLNGTTLTVTNRQGVSTSVNTKGEQGAQGPVGPEGPQGETGISIVSFLPKSETATTLIYTITYSNGHTQDVAIPKGPKGDTGATGPTGPQGPQGDTGVSITGFVETGETETATLYNITFSNGTTQQVAIPKGEKGDQGPAGPTGPQGPMGDVAVITPEQQAAFTMYSTTGQNTNGPMTQKAVTDALVAEAISYDNSQSGLNSSNVQGAISETNDKTADYLFEDITEQFSFTNGKGIQTNDGDLRQGGIASYSDYIDLSGYNVIRFTAIRLASNSYENPFGAAFYNSSKTFLPNTAITYKEYAGSAVGDLYIVEAKIPQGAKYMRVTWWASSVSGYSNFKCMAGRDIVGIAKELTLMPDLNTIYWNNMGTLYPLPTTPLNAYIYSGGILTINFTNNTTESLTTDAINGITIGKSYKITVKMRKTSDLGGFISIGLGIGTNQTEAFRRISPSTIETTYVFNVKAITYTKLFVGIPKEYNKGETYIISEIKIENANATDGYITEAAKKIIQLESAYNPTITDLQSYITENAGKDIFIPAGTYVCNNLTIPNGTRLHGIAGATTLQLTNGATSIINLTANSSDITIDGIRFVGNNDMSSTSSATAMSLADLRARVGEGTECGIYGVGHSRKILIQNCEFTRFSLAGIRFYETHTSALYTWKVKITDCTFTNNWYGYLSDTHSEYHTVMGCSFNYNQVGAFIAGGNNTFSECRFDANGTGFVVSGTAGMNDSHGSAGTCSFNHNKGYGIAIIDINNGYSFTGCHVFDCTGIIISNSIGFNYVGGMVACKIIVDSERNAGYNMFAEDIFTTTYNSGTIEGNPTKLSLHGNRFLTQNDCSSINNEI